MARILRGERGWVIFPKLELVSVAFGGFCGYHLGEMSAVYKESYVDRLARKIDKIKKDWAEALRKLDKSEEKPCGTEKLLVADGEMSEDPKLDLDLYEKMAKEYKRSRRELDQHEKKLLQKERFLKNFEKELIKRERKGRSAEDRKNTESEG